MINNKISKLGFLLVLVLVVTGCGHLAHESHHAKHNAHNGSFDPADLKATIAELNTQWDKGLQNQDINIFLELYDENAHYLPNDAEAIQGNQAIAENWKNAFGIITGVTLNTESLEGNKQILYETGNGTVEIANDSGGTDKSQFKYVNVWKLQADGSYKVVIDIFNSLGG
jgi:ketosteroid isomerase-like protein